MPVLHAKAAMWSRKQSVCSAVSGLSRGDEADLPLASGVQLYPFAIALRVRVLQIVCGIGGLVLGAVGWLEERHKLELGLGVPAGAITVLAADPKVWKLETLDPNWPLCILAAPYAIYYIIICFGVLKVNGAVNVDSLLIAILGSNTIDSILKLAYWILVATSIYYSRGFGGWASSKARVTKSWGAPWRVLGPSLCAAVPLTILWTMAIGANIAMLVFCMRSLMNIGCGSTTCIGVAAAQLSLSISTLAAAVFMFQLDLRFDASLSPPPRQSDAHICTAVSMVPLTSVAVNSGNSDAAEPGGSPQSKENEPLPQPPEPT